MCGNVFIVRFSVSVLAVLVVASILELILAGMPGTDPTEAMRKVASGGMKAAGALLLACVLLSPLFRILRIRKSYGEHLRVLIAALVLLFTDFWSLVPASSEHDPWVSAFWVGAILLAGLVASLLIPQRETLLPFRKRQAFILATTAAGICALAAWTFGFQAICETDGLFGPGLLLAFAAAALLSIWYFSKREAEELDPWS